MSGKTTLLWAYRKFNILRIRPSREIVDGSRTRISWEIDGEDLWFESDDIRLIPSPEAGACIAFAASALAGWRTRFPEPVEKTLISGFRKIAEFWTDWWQIDPSRSRIRASRQEPRKIPGRTKAVFLTLGVDSFYTLFENPDIGLTIYVAGFDVMLDETERLRQIETSLRVVAKERNSRLCIIRTNTRSHHITRKLGWEKFHGCALAAVGHLLSNEVSEVLISASFQLNNPQPWGSSWKTDSLWSSSALGITHFGEEHFRLEKLGKYADEPLLREHLRICWEHRNSKINCGLCEKCLRTMINLVILKRLDEFRTFPGLGELVIRLSKAKPLRAHMIKTYQGFLDYELPSELESAIRNLVRKSLRKIERQKQKANELGN